MDKGWCVGEEQKWIRDIQRRGSRQAAVKTRYYRLMALLGLSVVLTLAARDFTVVLSQFSGGGIGWGKWFISGWKKERTGSCSFLSGPFLFLYGIQGWNGY